MAKTIIIADDHPLFRTAMQAALGQVLENPAVYEAGTIAELQNIMDQGHSPDLILLDLHMPGAHGLSGLIFLRGQHPNIPVAIVSATEDAGVIKRAIHHGASGFIPKSLPMETMNEAINTLLSGAKWLPPELSSLPDDEVKAPDIESRLASLTPQQFRVLGMISEGLLNKQIAFELEVSEATIKAHVTAIFKKLGVRSRTQAVIAIQELEIEPPSSETNSGNTEGPQ
ncbi:response regulator transcription factor [Endozoicomonas sp. Mp262]|uniref:response regulator n=1 Tax=Endozoicomonas sp. Mp262 TaxID=2919499 RepID=UPI0021D8109C